MTPKEAIEILTWYKKSWKNLISTPKYSSSHLIDAVELAIQALEEKQEPEIVPIGTKVRVKICKLSDEMTIINYDANREGYICQVRQIQVVLKREEFEIIEQ